MSNQDLQEEINALRRMGRRGRSYGHRNRWRFPDRHPDERGSISKIASAVSWALFVVTAAILGAMLVEVLMNAFLADTQLWLVSVLGLWRWGLFGVLSLILASAIASGFSASRAFALLGILPFLYFLNGLLGYAMPGLYEALGPANILTAASVVYLVIVVPVTRGAGIVSGVTFVIAFLSLALVFDWYQADSSPVTYLESAGMVRLYSLGTALAVAAFLGTLMRFVDYSALAVLPASLSAAAVALFAVTVGLESYEETRAEIGSYEGVRWQLFGEGNRRFDLDDPAGALLAYEAAAIGPPGLPQAWAGMGHALVGLDRLDDAENAYSQAIARDENYIGAWLGRGWVRWFQGNLEGAETDYRRLVALDPNLIGYYLELERVLYEQDKPLEVAAMWAGVIRDKQDWTDALALRIYALERAGDWATILGELPAVLQADGMGDIAYLHYLLGRAFNEAGQHGSAIGPLRRAVDLMQSGPKPAFTFFQSVKEELMFTYVWMGDRPTGSLWQVRLAAIECKIWPKGCNQ